MLIYLKQFFLLLIIIIIIGKEEDNRVENFSIKTGPMYENKIQDNFHKGNIIAIAPRTKEL